MLNGDVVLDCSLNADNTLNRCQIVEETPAGYGFGEAALGLMCLGRISDDAAGIYTSEADERRIRRPMRFRLP